MIERLYADYDSPAFTPAEFEEDLLRFRYINQIFTKYRNGKGINARLLINHIVVASNVFPSTWAEASLEEIADENIKLFYTTLAYMGRINKVVVDEEFMTFLEQDTNER